VGQKKSTMRRSMCDDGCQEWGISESEWAMYRPAIVINFWSSWEKLANDLIGDDLQLIHDRNRSHRFINFKEEEEEEEEGRDVSYLTVMMI